MSDPNERLDVARNHIGNARLQVLRMPETNSTRATLALVDRGLHELALLPSFPPRTRSEAGIFFEGASLESAVAVILSAAGDAGVPVGHLPVGTIDRVVSSLVGAFSDRELAFLSGQVEPPVSQVGLPAGRRRHRVEPDPA